jgi:hypothetical protein
MFEFNKIVTPNKIVPLRGVKALLVLVLIPVIFIGIILIALAGLAEWIYSRFTQKSLLTKSAEPPEPRVRELISKENLHISLHEINTPELEGLLDEWYENVYDEEEMLFMATTEPKIEGIHQRIITNFCLEKNNGIFLQRISIIENTIPKELGSELIWIDCTDLKIKTIEPVGCYFLYMDKEMIKGFNKQESIEIQIQKTP